MYPDETQSHPDQCQSLHRHNPLRRTLCSSSSPFCFHYFSLPFRFFSFKALVRLNHHYKKNTLPWWYVFVIVGRVFCHACTSMTNLWQNQDTHTCAVVEVFHDITKIIITEVSTSMTINAASWKCFRQGWLTRRIHRNRSLLSYRVRFWIR